MAPSVNHKIILNEQVETLGNLGTWVLNLKTNQLSWSDGIFRMLGYEPQEFELSPERAIKIIHPSDRSNATHLMENAIVSGKKYSTRKRLISKENKIVHVKSSAQIVCNEDGIAIELVGVFQDISEFVNAEQSVEEQNTLLHDLIKKLPSAFFLFNQKGEHLLWNEKLESYTGYNTEEIANIHPINFYEGEDKDKINCHIKKVWEEGYTELQAWLTSKNKEKVPLYFTASTIQYNGQKCIFGTATNIQKSITLEDNLKNATELARLGAWEVNLITGENFMSPMTKEIHELPLDYKPTLEAAINFYHMDFRPLVESAVKEAEERGKPFDFEAKIVTAKGNERWIRSVGNAKMRDGKCIKLYGSFQDIHERKTIEKRLSNISDNVPGVLFRYHLRPDGTDFIDHVSSGAHQLWGLDPDLAAQNINLVWAGIEKGGEIEKVKAAITESARKMSRFHLSWRYITPDGEIRYHICDANPEKTADGTIIWDTIITDATDLQYYERLSKRISEMAQIGNWELRLPENGQNANTYWSATARQLFDLTDDYDLLATGGLEFCSEESRLLAENAVRRLLKKGEKFDLELLIQTLKGNKKWIRCIGDYDSVNGRVVRIFGSVQDIDKRKRTELAVHEVLTEKEEILESIGDVFYAVDKDWKVTYWNKEAEAIFDRRRENIRSKNIWHVLGRNNEYYRQYLKALQTQKQVQFEDYFPKLNKWFEISAYPSKKGLSVFFKDISRRKKAEETLKTSKERFELAALATNDSIWDWDISSNETVRAGKGFERLFGYKRQQFDSELNFWSTKVHPEDLERVLDSLHKVLNQLESNFWTCEYRFKKEDNTYAYVIDRGFIIRNEKGEATRMIGATTNITNQRQYEESLIKINDLLRKQTQELRMSNAELEQFAYVASHDLQEPLRMVSGFLSQLEKKYSDQLDEKAHQYINFATDGAKRMRQIILDLLDFSRIGKQTEKAAQVDLNEIVAEVCLLNRKKIEEVNAKIFYSNLPVIEAHPTLMIQLFQNLINNGIKYSRPNIDPQIYVKAEELQNEWKFSIEDNGIGIEEQYFEQIFTIFQRLHNRDAFSGTGMGLAIVKKIIENNGGRIWIESGVGKGSIFHFTLAKI